jgi:hypothetical protein
VLMTTGDWGRCPLKTHCPVLCAVGSRDAGPRLQPQAAALDVKVLEQLGGGELGLNAGRGLGFVRAQRSAGRSSGWRGRRSGR